MPNLFIDTIKGIPKAAGDLATSLFKGSIFDNSKPDPALRFKVGENLNPQQTNVARQIIRRKPMVSIKQPSPNINQSLDILTNKNISDPNIRKEAFSSLSAPVMGVSGGLEDVGGKVIKPLIKDAVPRLFTGFKELSTNILEE